MANKSMSYDHPAYTVRQAAPVNLHAAAASVSIAKFVAFTAMKIKGISTMVNIAGTATGAGYDFNNGTSSVGGVTLGTAAAGTEGTRYETDITLASGGYLDIKTKAASATLSASAMIEFELIPGANVTV